MAPLPSYYPMLGEGMFNKLCAYCGREFQSESRNTRYCSKECCDKAQKRKTKVNKAREVRRRRYDQTREIQLLLATSYRAAERMAFLTLEKKCACNGLIEKDGPLELHHKDGNPLNNSPSNLVWLTKSKHAKLHTLLPNINWVDVLEKATRESRPPMEIFEELKGGVDILEMTNKFLVDNKDEVLCEIQNAEENPTD